MEQQSQIQATANSDHTEYGTAIIRVYSPQMVMKRVIQKLLFFWGLAIFSVFLPVVHFVLVPLFFMLGIYFAVQARKVRFEISDGEIHCPRCRADVKIKKAAFEEDHKEICQQCAGLMKVWPVS